MYKQQCRRKLLFVCHCYLQIKVIAFLFLVPSEGLSLITNCHTLSCVDSSMSLFSVPPLIDAPFQQRQTTQVDPNDNDDTSAVWPQWRLRAFKRPSSPTLTSGKMGGSRAVQLAPQILVSWLRLLLLAHTPLGWMWAQDTSRPQSVFFSSLFSLIFLFFVTILMIIYR